MTNADKLLQVSKAEFLDKLRKVYFSKERILNQPYTYQEVEEFIIEFLNAECKPTLTEDERVILKNIKGDCKYVGRKYDNERNYSEGILYICARTSSSVEYKYLGCYSHLFQFIKERRRISNRGTFERRIKC